MANTSRSGQRTYENPKAPLAMGCPFTAEKLGDGGKAVVEWPSLSAGAAARQWPSLLAGQAAGSVTAP